MIRPKEALLSGARILEGVLLPERFAFEFRGEGQGSGGNFAWGEFVREQRRLEIHFRHNLGLVRYHLGEQSAAHEYYMRELAVFSQCRYPGFSETPDAGFLDLAHDLRLTEDFLRGDGTVLLQAAAKEALDTAEREAEALAGYVGDKDKIERMHVNLSEGRYDQVVWLAQQLKFPKRITESEQKIVEIARQRDRK